MAADREVETKLAYEMASRFERSEDRPLFSSPFSKFDSEQNLHTLAHLAIHSPLIILAMTWVYHVFKPLIST